MGKILSILAAILALVSIVVSINTSQKLGSGGGTVVQDVDSATIPVSLTTDITGTLPIENGGTENTFFGSSTLLYGNGLDALQGTSSPVVGFINATSTATSSFAGKIILSNQAGNLAIGTTSPDLAFTLASTSAYILEQDLGLINGATTIDWKLGNQAFATLITAAPAITFSRGWPGQAVRFIACQDATAGREPTFDSSVRFASTSANAFTDRPNSCDVVSAIWTSGTSTSYWLAVINAGGRW